MVVYELVESCNEPYEQWDNSIALYKSKELADNEAASMNAGNNPDDTITYSVEERELIM